MVGDGLQVQACTFTPDPNPRVKGRAACSAQTDRRVAGACSAAPRRSPGTPAQPSRAWPPRLYLECEPPPRELLKP